MVIEEAVTPGALAVLAAPVAAVVVPVLPTVVGGELDLEELPQPAATMAATPSSATTL
jgi:hypothetical protein